MALVFSNENLNDIVKMIKSQEESGLSIKGVRETINNEAEEQKGRLLIMLLGTLGASSLRNLLTGEGTIRIVGGTIRTG